jgi:putative ABC transport system permease protein
MSSGGGLVKIAGIDKQRLREFIDTEVDPAVWEEFTKRRNGALLGIDIATDEQMRERYVWEQGKEFAMADFNGLTLYMAGTFTPRDPMLRSVILTGDIFLQEVDNRRGVTNQFLVRVRHRDETQRVGEAIDALDAPVKLHAETQQAARDEAVADLDEMLRYATIVIFVVGLVILLGVANATAMTVRDRTREVGVLRALGFTRRKVAALIAGEALIVTLVGGLLGSGLAWLVLTLNRASMNVGALTIPITVGLALAAGAVLASGVVGMLGGLPAGVRASRQPIVESLRSVD